MKFPNLLLLLIAFLGTAWLVVWGASFSLDEKVASTIKQAFPPAPTGEVLTIGYSNEPGYWPWAVAEAEGLFAANGLNVDLRWFESYSDSMEALATGELDGNSQTLNDTIAFAAQAAAGEVGVLVNNCSSGDDKIIATEGIDRIRDLQGKQVLVEEGTVTDFLLTLALEDAGMSRADVEIVSTEIRTAVTDFATGTADAIGTYSPYWMQALERPGSQEIISSAAYPGAIPDLLVMTQNAVEQRPGDIQAMVKTWMDTLAFIEEHPRRADVIMARRAGLELAELHQLTVGLKLSNLQDNLQAFRKGQGMSYMPYAARVMADFMTDVGLIEKVPDLPLLLDSRFVENLA